MKKSLRAPFLSIVAAVALASAAALNSPPHVVGAGQSSRNGNLQITQFQHVVITGDDVRDLPDGENRIVQKAGGGNAASTGLTKAGTGTLRLSNSESGADLTKTGSGTLALPRAASGGVTKQGTGTLVLTGANSGVVYEFRDVRPADFGRVFVHGGEARGAHVTLERFVRQSRPEDAMRGWPFRRLLVGPAGGIAEVEGWRPGRIGSAPTPGGKYVCTTTHCSCSGGADCLSLADAGACSSNMTCVGEGDGINCSCSKS